MARPARAFWPEEAGLVAEALARTDMTDFADRRWQTLSGSERQRAHIARALA